MDKARLIKLMRRKVYWERERDKCFLHIFFFYSFLAGLSIKTSSYPGIKKINEIGWGNSDGWDKFNCVFDWFLIVILFIYLLFAVYYLIRIQTCSHKLVHLNQHLLEELNGLSEADIK